MSEEEVCARGHTRRFERRRATESHPQLSVPSKQGDCPARETPQRRAVHRATETRKHVSSGCRSRL